MPYRKMKCSQILKELDSETKARAWIWLAKFEGKEFVCPKCKQVVYYQHKANPEIRECKSCHFQTRLRANTIFQHSKISGSTGFSVGEIITYVTDFTS